MPSDLPSASSTYVGKCVKSDSEIRYAWKSSTRMYVLQMEDGREFWFDSISCQWGDIDISHFYDVVPGKVITVRYIDFNYSLGSFAKKAVEIRDENEVFSYPLTLLHVALGQQESLCGLPILRSSLYGQSL